MTEAFKATRQKWRPSLSLVVFLVLTAVLSLPLFSLYFLKLYQNELIQQTESELIAQSAALAAVFEREISAQAEGLVLGVIVPPPVQSEDDPYQPIWPKLELADQSVLPPRPDALPPAKPAEPGSRTAGCRLVTASTMDSRRMVSRAGSRWSVGRDSQVSTAPCAVARMIAGSLLKPPPRTQTAP